LLDKILAHPWQFCLIVLCSATAFWIISRSVESPLIVLGNFFKNIPSTVREELRGESLAGIVNVCIVFFSFILAVGLVSPTILHQLGLFEKPPHFGMVLIGVCLFAGAVAASCHLMNSFREERAAYSDNSH